jgi:hypothetical protein
MHDKRSTLAALWFFIGLIVAAFVAMLVLLITCLLFSSEIARDSISSYQRGIRACSFGIKSSCTRCDELLNRCPEWTEDDLDTVVRGQAFYISTLTVIFMVYAARAVRYGMVNRQYYDKYQIAYV